jgi:hypothetical protein
VKQIGRTPVWPSHALTKDTFGTGPLDFIRPWAPRAATAGRR